MLNAKLILDCLKNNGTKLVRDKNHKYFYNDKEIKTTSVSGIPELSEYLNKKNDELLDKIPFNWLKIDTINLKKAQNIGNEIHDAVDKGKDLVTHPIVEKINEFLKSKMHLRETKLYSENFNIAGEFDGIYYDESTDKLVIYDIKTGNYFDGKVIIKYNLQLKIYLCLIIDILSKEGINVEPKNFQYVIWKLERDKFGNFIQMSDFFKNNNFTITSYNATRILIEDVIKNINNGFFIDKKNKYETKKNEINKEISKLFSEEMIEALQNRKDEEFEINNKINEIQEKWNLNRIEKFEFNSTKLGENVLNLLNLEKNIILGYNEFNDIIKLLVGKIPCQQEPFKIELNKKFNAHGEFVYLEFKESVSRPNNNMLYKVFSTYFKENNMQFIPKELWDEIIMKNTTITKKWEIK